MLQRIRTIKQEFFRHEGLFDLERETGFPIRIAFCGLWTCCDREGRFEWRDRRLKTMILPYDDVDFSRVLDALVTRAFVVKYEVGGQEYGLIPSFKRHQVINNRESGSELPAPGQEPLSFQLNEPLDASTTRDPHDDDASTTPLVHAQAERNGTERNWNGTEKDSCAAASATPAIEYEIDLSLNDGTAYQISLAQVAEWQIVYPAVNVMQQLRQMREWLTSNPRNRRTRSSIRGFITRWLGKEQNKAPRDIGVIASVPVKSQERVPEYQLPAEIDEQAGQKLWGAACDKLSKTVNVHTFDTWLRPVRAAGIAAGILYLSVPTGDFLSVRQKYGQQIEEIVDLDVTFFVRGTTDEFYRAPKRQIEPAQAVSA